MISDESSSDSETGRFKCRSKTQEETKSTNRKDDSNRPARRSRPSDNDRLRREFDRKRDERDRYERRSRDRTRHPRHSPISSSRRRHSREKSPPRRSRERHAHSSDISKRSKPIERSGSRDIRRRSRSRKPSERTRAFREEIKLNIAPKEKSPIKERKRQSIEKKSSSPEFRGKRSEVCRPTTVETLRKKVENSIVVDKNLESDSDEVQPGSYYSMIPAVVKEKSSPESSEIDSSDDERLRAKLLNLEKELHRTRKKKHKKKHKRKSSRSSKDKEVGTPVEVTSTTDIQEVKIDLTDSQPDVAEVTSTQKSNQKESSEEGEISSDDNSQNSNIDPTDLRHRLKRTAPKDVCGPALPPHLEKKYAPDIEGPALPTYLQKMDKRLGPTIPENLRKTLAVADQVIVDESSDEDPGIGPLPCDAESKWSKAHQKLEERALDIKIKKLEGQSEGSKVKSREEWMLELPEGKAKILGLEARSFRAKAGPDMSDRSSWTDTPEEKARKAAGIVKEEDSDIVLQREARAKHIANRDEEQEKVIKKHKKKHKRDESLLDLHQKKIKKKKKKEEKEDKRERRPFSRDVDLQANRFDEAQKQSIIKKAQGLNTRFSRGEAKYL